MMYRHHPRHASFCSVTTAPCPALSSPLLLSLTLSLSVTGTGAARHMTRDDDLHSATMDVLRQLGLPAGAASASAKATATATTGAATKKTSGPGKSSTGAASKTIQKAAVNASKEVLKVKSQVPQVRYAVSIVAMSLVSLEHP